jgi:hypothetical protein
MISSNGVGHILNFGYGDITVKVFMNELVFQNIKPPQPIGVPLDRKKFEYIEGKVTIDDEETLTKLYKKLLDIKGSNEAISINVNNMYFNFIGNSKKSIDVVIRGVEKALDWYVLISAC